MKNNKMTPGPWVANGLTVSTANKMPAQMGNRDPRHIDVAIAYYDHEEADLCKLWNYDEACANADAIAALPDLIEALNALANAANPRPGCYTTCVDKEVEQARAALTKAGVL